MVKYFYRSKKGSKITELKTFKSGCWISVVTPTELEQKTLIERFGIEPGHLRDGLDMYEVPRLEREDGTLYFFTRFPQGEGENITTAPLLIIVADSFIMSVSPVTPKFLDRFRNIEADFTTTNSSQLMLQILLYCSRAYNYFLNRITKQIRTIEVNLEKIKNTDIVRFVAFEGIVGDFRPVLLRNNALLEEYGKQKSQTLSKTDKDLVEDVILSNKQMIEIADDSLRTIVNVRDGYTTIMTNNLNRVIKLLTSVTVILTIPTMIASIYGMNVRLPSSESHLAFWGIILVMLAVSGAVLFFFIREDYL